MKIIPTFKKENHARHSRLLVWTQIFYAKIVDRTAWQTLHIENRWVATLSVYHETTDYSVFVICAFILIQQLFIHKFRWQNVIVVVIPRIQTNISSHLKIFSCCRSSLNLDLRFQDKSFGRKMWSLNPNILIRAYIIFWGGALAIRMFRAGDKLR